MEEPTPVILDEFLKEETPNDPLNNLAPVGKRLANYLIDVIICIVLLALLGIILGIIAATRGTESGFFDDKFGVRVTTALLMLAYYIFFEGLFGRTPGKFITGTRVVNKLGGKPPLSTIAGRSLCRLIPFEAFSYLGNNNIGWHDKFSDTLVVNVRRR